MKRILGIAAALVVACVLIWRPAQPAAPIAVASAIPSRRPAMHPRPGPSADSVVYVAGAVARPGLYRLSPGSRADDGVRRAGGLRPDADASAINLAAHVADGDEIFVPVLGQPTPRPVRRRTARQSAKKTPTAVVNVNHASASELGAVPGIGRVLAARIVEMRDRDGAFANYDELLDVAGMTPARLERAEPYLQI